MSTENAPNSNFYVDYVTRDLSTIVENVVPEGRQGLPNLMSTKQARPFYGNLVGLTLTLAFLRYFSDPRKLEKQTRRRTSKNRRRNDRPLRPVLSDLRPRPNRTYRPPFSTRPLFLPPFLLSPLNTPTCSPPRNIPPHRRRPGTAQTPPRAPMGPPRLAQKPSTISHFVPAVSFVHADDGRWGWGGGVDDRY